MYLGIVKKVLGGKNDKFIENIKDLNKEGLCYY